MALNKYVVIEDKIYKSVPDSKILKAKETAKKVLQDKISLKEAFKKLPKHKQDDLLRHLREAKEKRSEGDFAARKKPARHVRMRAGKPYQAGKGSKKDKLPGDKYAVIGQSFNRETNEPTSQPRKEIINIKTNELFRDVINTKDSERAEHIKGAYESFWNDLNPESEDIVRVSSVKPVGGKSNSEEDFAARKKPARHTRKLRTGKVVQAGKEVPEKKEVTEEAPKVEEWSLEDVYKEQLKKEPDKKKAMESALSLFSMGAFDAMEGSRRQKMIDSALSKIGGE